MDSNWTIRPRKGLGPLEFGMTPENVAALQHIYGAPELERTNKVNSGTLEETMAQFPELFSEQDLKAAKEALAEHGSPNSLRIEVYSLKGFTLEYDNNSLVAIQILPEANLINIGSEYIFRKSSDEALKIFETANREPAYLRSTQAAFKNLAVSLDNFSVTIKNDIEPIKSSDPRFPNRNIELRSAPYLPEHELSQFVRHSFL